MQHHLLSVLFRKMPEETLRWKSYFAEENIQVSAEVESVNRSAVGALRVVHSHN